MPALADFGHIERIITEFDIAVDNDNWDLGILCLFEDRIPPRLDNGNESDDINALGNKGTNCLDLVLLLLLCIRELQVDACIFSCRFQDSRFSVFCSRAQNSLQTTLFIANNQTIQKTVLPPTVKITLILATEPFLFSAITIHVPFFVVNTFFILCYHSENILSCFLTCARTPSFQRQHRLRINFDFLPFRRKNFFLRVFSEK